jgi:hypothetical protein
MVADLVEVDLAAVDADRLRAAAACDDLAADLRSVDRALDLERRDAVAFGHERPADFEGVEHGGWLDADGVSRQRDYLPLLVCV